MCAILRSTLTPRLILHKSSPSGFTDATTTSAPNRVSVSVMHVVSISSLSSAIGTRTRFADAAAVVDDIFLRIDEEFDDTKELWKPSGAMRRKDRGDVAVTVKAGDNGSLTISRVSDMKDFIEHANGGRWQGVALAGGLWRMAVACGGGGWWRWGLGFGCTIRYPMI